MGAWPDGYYIGDKRLQSAGLLGSVPGAGLYALERTKMITGDPTAKIVAFNTNNLHGGMFAQQPPGLYAAADRYA
jgi:hypothetical protein